LQDRFFELLARTKKLDLELAALKNATPGKSRYAAVRRGGWRVQSHFEQAAPVMQAITADCPADAVRATRTASLFRSLAPTRRRAIFETLASPPALSRT